MLERVTPLRWTLLALVMVLFAINLHQQRSHLTPVTWIAIILTVAIFTAGALLLMLAVTGLSARLRSRRGSTAAEVHTFSLTTEGLARRSASSDSN